MQKDQKNKNSHVICLITYMFMSLEHGKKKDKVQVSQLNEMLTFHLVLLVKMNNVIPKKIYLMIGIYLKNLILQKVVHNRK